MMKNRIFRIDHWRHAVAGRIPPSISGVTLYGVDQFGGRTEAIIDHGAFYADWVGGERYILALESKHTKRNALFAVDVSTRPPGTLRYDISNLEYRKALLRHGSPFSHPTKIISGLGGDMWFLNPSGNSVGRVDRNGSVRTYELPTFDSVPVDIASTGDSVWITEFNSEKLARISFDGRVVEFTLPSISTGAPATEPQGRGLEYLVAGSDGRIWFSERFRPYIGAADKDGRVAEYRVDGGSGNFFWTKGIVRGPDGRIWFIADNGLLHGVVGALSGDGAVQRWEFSSTLGSIASGLNDVWVAEEAAVDHSHITRINLDGQRTSYEVPLLKSTPQVMAEAGDGSLWFLADEGNTLGDISPSGTIAQEYARGHIASLIRGSDGRIWYSTGSFINGGLGSLLGGYDIFTISPSNADPSHLAVGPDGELWFTEFQGNAVGFVGPDRTIKCFSLSDIKQINCGSNGFRLRRISKC